MSRPSLGRLHIARRLAPTRTDALRGSSRSGLGGPYPPTNGTGCLDRKPVSGSRAPRRALHGHRKRVHSAVWFCDGRPEAVWPALDRVASTVRAHLRSSRHMSQPLLGRLHIARRLAPTRTDALRGSSQSGLGGPSPPTNGTGCPDRKPKCTDHARPPLWRG